MNAPHTELRFRLDLSNAQYMAYYQGLASSIQTLSLDGRRVRFPASILRPHVRHDGVHGLFALRVDADNRVVDLRRLGD